jgi:ABC-type glycerol-3-phosphate transport system substrate-binding protein
MHSVEAEMAVDTLRRLADRAPSDLPDGHYDEVDRALFDGRVDAAGAWPGAWGAIRSSPGAADLEPFPYPAGSTRRVTYSGCHAWAIPTTCGNVDGAVKLVHTLLGHAAQALDARGGNICAHEGALQEVQPVDERDRRRLDITRRTIAESMITYPTLGRFPEIEDAGWSTIRDVLRGAADVEDALRSLQETAERVLR